MSEEKEVCNCRYCEEQRYKHNEVYKQAKEKDIKILERLLREGSTCPNCTREDNRCIEFSYIEKAIAKIKDEGEK